MKTKRQRNVIVTGGSRGIGFAIARAFLESGYHVTILARNVNELQKATKELSVFGSVACAQLDVSNETAVRNFIRNYQKEHTKLDVLVNAAAILGPIGPLEKADSTAWMSAITVDLFGTFLMTRACIPLLRKSRRGTIINFVGGGDGARPNFSAYVAAKGGVARLTETLAAELAPRVTVNAIAPGAVNTSLLEAVITAGPKAAGKKEYDDARRQKKTGGVDPEKAADLAVWLASDDARQFSGKIFSAVWDSYKEFPAHAKEIASSDLFTMRRVRPGDRGFGWGRNAG